MSIERYTADEALQDVDDVLEKYLMPIGISKADALDRIIHVVNRYLVAKPADCHAAAPASAWVPKADSLPTEPGWYLVMLAPDNDWELMSDTPLQVEFGAYKNKPQSFTIFYNDAPGEDITAAVTHWMRMPPAPGAQVDAPKDAGEPETRRSTEDQAVERTLLKRASQALAWAPLASIPDGWAIHDDIVRHLASQPADAEQPIAAGDESRS